MMKDNELAALQPYCENDMRLLKKISNSIFLKFNEPLQNADYADFYSIANETLWKAYNAYNPDTGISFDVFLRTCLKKKFITEIRSRHRDKRAVGRYAVPLESQNREGEDSCLLDIIPSDFDTFEEALKEEDGGQYQDKVQQYISKLSRQQINILNLLIDGYKPNEIQQILEISSQRYAENLWAMRSYEIVKILF